MNKKIAIISAAFALSIPIIPAFAQTADLAVKPEDRGQVRTLVQQQKQETQEIKTTIEDKRAQVTAKRLEFQEKEEAMAAEKCKNLETKIATRVSRYENNGQMLQKVYGNMKTRLDRLSAKLKTAGADTSKLDTDLAALYAKIDKLYADQALFMITLKETQTFVCGKSEGEFKGKIDQARKVPEIIKQDREDIKTLFQTTIKADLQAIRAVLETQNPAVETGEQEAAKEVKVPKANVKKSVAPEVTAQPATSTTTVQQ